MKKFCVLHKKKIHLLYLILITTLTHITLTGTYASNDLQLLALNPINNFHPSQYRGDSQNWKIIQDDRGIIYVANLNGVFEFDGINWRLIRLPDNSYVTSMGHGNDGTIFIGGNAKFGYLSSDKKGSNHYVSLLDKFPEEERFFSFIWDFFQTTHGLYFHTYEKLFRYHNDTVSSLDIFERARCFMVDDKIFYFDFKNQELISIYNNHKEVYIDFKNLNNKNVPFRILHGMPYNEDEILLFCNYNGFFTIPKNKQDKDNSLLTLNKLKNQNAANHLIQNEFNIGIRMVNGDYALGSNMGGMIIMAPDGSIIRNINKNSGLQNETINYIKEDKCNNLWLALDNGISLVNTSIPVTFFDHRMDFEGSVLNVNVIDDNLYVGTWHGIYYLQKKEQNKKASGTVFNQVKNFKGRVWKILASNKDGEKKTKYAITGHGIYSFNKDKAQQVNQGMYYDAVQSEDMPEIILAAGFDKLTLLLHDKTTKKLKKVYDFPDFINYEIFRIKEGNGLKFWLTTHNNGISAISLTSKKHKSENSINIPDTDLYYTIEDYNNAHGLPSTSNIKAFQVFNNTLLYTPKGVFSEKHSSEKTQNREVFEKNTGLSHITEKAFIPHIIETDSKNNIWIHATHIHSREKLLFLFYYDPSEEKHEIQQLHFDPIRNSNINSITFEDINDAVIAWISTDDAIIRYDAVKGLPEPPECKTLIRKIILNNQHLYYNGGQVNSESITTDNHIPGLETTDTYTELDYATRSITFEFVAPIYYNSEDLLYSTFLENFDDEWSNWKNKRSVFYPNLSPGRYYFKVKARDLFGNETEASIFSFIIKPPWYQTPFMYLLYIAALGLLVFLIVRITNQRLVSTKNKLEKLVKERTSEIAKQRQLIEIEKEKSDKLLRNILPLQVAHELKANGKVETQYYDTVTVMFMDFKGFSKIAQFINPLHLLSELDKTFGFIDDVCIKHGLEKIKTMGDAYLCAGGIPIPNLINPFSSIFAAFEIMEYLRRAEKNQWLSEIRIGIHTGELIAGVIGKYKFAYDIWGETVNTASRMENSGVPMKINISGETYELIHDYFECHYRGKLPAKHKDEYDMYFVNRIKREYSEDDNGFIPNKKFMNELMQKFG